MTHKRRDKYTKRVSVKDWLIWGGGGGEVRGTSNVYKKKSITFQKLRSLKKS